LGEKFDPNVLNIFVIQDEITQTVAGTLAEKIWQVSAKALAKKPLSNFKAWDYLLRGRTHFHKGGKQELAKARTFFKRALELDPDLSLAYIWLAWTYYIDWRFFETETEDLDKAEALANKVADYGDNKFRTYIQRLRLYKNETDIEHFIDDLRKAGLPE